MRSPGGAGGGGGGHFLFHLCWGKFSLCGVEGEVVMIGLGGFDGECSSGGLAVGEGDGHFIVAVEAAQVHAAV